MTTTPIQCRPGETLALGACRVRVELVCEDGRVLLLCTHPEGVRVVPVEVAEPVRVAEPKRRSA